MNDHSNILMRNDTAKQYRRIHRLLRGTDTEPDEFQAPAWQGWSVWIVMIIMSLAFWVAVGILLAGCAQAQDLTASWYSVESLKSEGTWAYSHGIMANGRMFKDNDLTCATRLCPLGTNLRVTSLITHKSVIVKVTDRIGKRFARKRIDLSKSAFEKIDNIDKGLIKVRVQKI